MHRLAPRIERLEDAAPTGKPFYVFWWIGRQTREQAIAGQYPNGVPANRDLVFVTWGKADAEAPHTH